MRSRGITIYAQPDRSGEGMIYEREGQRGFYFDDPDRNLMELIERSENEVDHEIRELADTWTAAEVDGDLEILDEILTDEFRGIGPLGFVLDKAAWLHRFAGGLHNKTLSFEGSRSRPRATARRSSSECSANRQRSMTSTAAASTGSASLQ